MRRPGEPARLLRRVPGVLVGSLLLTSPVLVGPVRVAAQAAAHAGDPSLEERAADVRSLRAVEAEQWDDALRVTLELVDRFPARPGYLARLAQIYNRMHRPVDEVAAWERFMRAAPRPGQACPMIGKAYRGLGQYEHAIDAFTRCLAADPANASLVYFVGLGHEWAGEFGLAREHYAHALAMAPPGYESRVAMARVDLHQDALAAARDGAVAVLTQVPTHVEAALVAGLAEQRAGHRAAARRHLELAAKLSPDYFDVRLALGILEYSESRIREARGHFEAAYLSDPGRRADVQPWLDRTTPQ